MKLQTIATIALSALHGVSTSPISRALAARSGIPSAEELSSSMNVFQNLVIDALMVSVPTNNSLPTRDISSGTLDSVNSIFDVIYGIADGSITVAEASIRHRMEPRSSVGTGSLIDLICKILGCGGKSILKRETFTDTQLIIDTLNAWADGSLPFALSDASHFTTEEALELATLLKDIVIAWRAKVDGGITSGGIISTRNERSVIKSSIYSSSDSLDKRGLTKAQVKAGLRILAATLNAIADSL